MTVAQYLALLRAQWHLVVAAVTVGLAGAGGWTYLATPVYEASAEMFVSLDTPADSVTDLTSNGAFMQQRVKSYTRLVTSPKVLDPVVAKLKLGTTSEALAGQVTATSPLDTVLIDVSVKDGSPQRAAQIANAITESFSVQVVVVETPRTPGASLAVAQATKPRVTVTVISRAVAPSAPVSPRVTLNLALGMLVGLGLGVGLAVLRDSLDRTVGRRLAMRIAEAPVLASIADDTDADKKPLIMQHSSSVRVEAYRRLRSNVRFLGVDQKVRTIVVTGSVPSEGKTTTAANLAIALAQVGENVVLIDADLRRPNVHNLFGLPSGVGLTSVLLGEVPLAAALHAWRDDLPLRVLACGPKPPNPAELIASERMAGLIGTLAQQGVTVVIDTPPLLPVNDAAVLARVADGAVIVVRSGTTRIEQLTAAVEALKTARATVLGVVLNRVTSGKHGGYGYGHGYGYGADGDAAGHDGDLAAHPVPESTRRILDLDDPPQTTPAWWTPRGAPGASHTPQAPQAAQAPQVSEVAVPAAASQQPYPGAPLPEHANAVETLWGPPVNGSQHGTVRLSAYDPKASGPRHR